MQQYFDYSPEVQQALRDKRPLLALESSVITHGLPYPQSLETAKAMEEITREYNVTPAIIAIMQGKIKIGLTPAELETLVHDQYILKAGTRDIPFILNEGLSAGTTVASTLYCADTVGIKVFATGGIGGVHRGASFDISADLIELARTPIAVICSGAKAILDIPKTLEFLETFGIPIVGYRTTMWPAFYTSSSPHRLSNRVDTIPSLVKLLRIYWQLGMSSSVLIVNALSDEDEIPRELIEPVIRSTLETAEAKGIRGKELTPFLLNEIARGTHGKSLQANIKLLKNNVKIGAMTAHALMSA